MHDGRKGLHDVAAAFSCSMAAEEKEEEEEEKGKHV